MTRRPAWHADALCKEHPEVDWFPELSTDTPKAVAICQRCAVRAECLEAALDNHERFGTWGGATAKDRRKTGDSWRGCEPRREPIALLWIARPSVKRNVTPRGALTPTWGSLVCIQPARRVTPPHLTLSVAELTTDPNRKVIGRGS